MSIRWRLAVLAIQVILLLVFTALVTGSPIADETWFASGLLAVTINRQLLEPFFARPQETLANCSIGLVLIVLAHKTVPVLWGVLAAFVLLGVLLSLAALILGAGREGDRASIRIARAARMMSGVWTSRAIYSGVFWLSVLEYARPSSTDFWLLGTAWLLVVGLGAIDWQRVFAAGVGRDYSVTIEGIVGPRLILLTSDRVPSVGATVRLASSRTDMEGIVVRRMVRAGDVWAEVSILSDVDAEGLMRAASVSLSVSDVSTLAVGAAEAGSSDSSLTFTATQDLLVGKAVSVRAPRGDLLYQIGSVRIEEARVRNGAHLVARVSGPQIGIFNPTTLRLEQHNWAPPPGGPVTIPDPEALKVPAPVGWLKLGSVIGASVPVFLDLTAAFQGHLAILGMTRMGKTTLCMRIARAIESERRVIVLDQTGEYVSKRGLSIADPADLWAPGLRVVEKPDAAQGAEFALDFVQSALHAAAGEYSVGDPLPRTIILDEAHQFIPEPANLGFGAPGRDAAIALGQLIMQMRKYGLAAVLVSQRTAVVAKSALSQCENLIVFKSVDQTGLDYLDAVGGSALRTLVPKLSQGEAVVCGPAISSDRPVAIRIEP